MLLVGKVIPCVALLHLVQVLHNVEQARVLKGERHECVVLWGGIARRGAVRCVVVRCVVVRYGAEWCFLALCYVAVGIVV